MEEVSGDASVFEAEPGGRPAPSVEGLLRVWWCPQFPMEPFYVPVESTDQALFLIETLALYDAFQFENKVKPDYCNAGGLEIFREGEWEDWENEEYDTIDDLRLRRAASPLTGPVSDRTANNTDASPEKAAAPPIGRQRVRLQSIALAVVMLSGPACAADSPWLLLGGSGPAPPFVMNSATTVVSKKCPEGWTMVALLDRHGNQTPRCAWVLRDPE